MILSIRANYNNNNSCTSNHNNLRSVVIDLYALGNDLVQNDNYIYAVIIYCLVILICYYYLNKSFYSNICGDCFFSLGDIYLENINNKISYKNNKYTNYPMWNLSYFIWKLGFEIYPNHNWLKEQCERINNLTYENNSVTTNNNDNDSIYNNDFIKEDFLIFNEKISKDPLIYISKKPILSIEECAYAIKTAELFSINNNGWSTSRHYNVPTTDIPISNVPSLSEWFKTIFIKKLKPMLINQFLNNNCYNKESIKIHDAFIVKYQYNNKFESQRYLPLHVDQSTHSLTIALNENEDFIGGGTYFADLDFSLRPEIGHVLSFKGDLLHSGDPIIKGIRYILAIFLYMTKYNDNDNDTNDAIESYQKNNNQMSDVFTKSDQLNNSIEKSNQSFSFNFNAS